MADDEEAQREQALKQADALLAHLPKDRKGRLQAIAKALDLFSAATLKIRTKLGGPLWPFVFNPIQMAYLQSLRERYARQAGLDAFRGIRDLIVKPRQLGFSTYIAALFFMDGFLSPGRVTVVLTHKSDLSQELLRTYTLFFECLPPSLKAAVKPISDTKYEMEWEFQLAPGEPCSRFVVATERGQPWRGGVIHNLHASEAAHYRDWAAFKASFVQAVPKSGNIVYETTVNGFNPYYEECRDAEAGKTGYRIVFYPWFMHPEYVLIWDEATQPPITEEEREAMEAYGLSLEQLAWRRWKQSEVKELFPQEYPETLWGAFLASGRPYFDMAAVDRGAMRAEIMNRDNPPKHPRAHVTVWEDPIPGEYYLLHADVAEGVNKGATGSDPEAGGADFCAGYVTHVQTLRTVATIHARIRPVEFGRVVDRLGRIYQACVAVERNNHGHTVLAALEASGYPEVYRHTEYNEQGKPFLKPGFPTTTATRPMILDALDEVIRSGALVSSDPGFWKECRSFHINDNGKAEALEGHHDDRVMAMAIGAFLCTIGRKAWNVGGADNSDSAGFPREAASSLPPVPAAAPAPSPVVPDDLSGGELREALLGIAQPPADGTCGACLRRSPEDICSFHRCRVQPHMPACQEGYYPAADDDDPENAFGEDWNL